MARQEIYGYLLTHWAISGLICQAVTEADIDPGRVKFTRTVRVVRRAISPAFPPEPPEKACAAIMADITSKRNLNPNAATAPTPAWSCAPGATPTASRNLPKMAPATTGRRRSHWSTCTDSAWQPDQHWLSGIGSRVA